MSSDNTIRNTKIRNIAIIAHVDHGKTTLVDHLLRQSGTFRDNQVVADRVMDSNDLEREKGITIMAKNASVRYRDAEGNETKINIVDTPGHSDFGGEVERVLSMVDGVLLLVDAAEGPLPQTRFVLKKALEMGLPPAVVINKIDRSDARPNEVFDEVLQLFINLGADYEQLDFPVLYAIAKQGIAKTSLEDDSTTLTPLFDMVVKHVPPPPADVTQPFQMIIAALSWNDYVGRIAIGRIHRGKVKIGDTVALIRPDGSIENNRITKLYNFEGMNRKEVESAEAGDIIALSGFENVHIGDTIADATCPEPLPYVNIDEPTLAMNFCVNNSPFAGREGKFVTTPKLSERLYRETRTNVALRVEDTDQPDIFKVSGRGELQLAILIETMRREGYEFAVSKPEVLYKRGDGGELLEPMEHVIVDVSQTHIGTVIELLGKRKAEMLNMTPAGDAVRAEFVVPSRGLIGFRTEFLTATRGEGILHHTFHGYDKHRGEFGTRTRGSLVSMETGPSTAYALEMVQERGVLFVGPGTEIYEGMVVGENSREDDLVVNPCRTKHLTNMRSSGSDGIVKLDTPRQLSLEQFIEFISEDELLEVTPHNIRIRKRVLDATERNRARKRALAEA
jgi:GTP-binding protein